jgi:hypothetical protein
MGCGEAGLPRAFLGAETLRLLWALEVGVMAEAADEFLQNVT